MQAKGLCTRWHQARTLSPTKSGPEVGKGGKIKHLRPIGLVSVLQKTDVACIIRKTRIELLNGSVNAFAERPGSSVDVAVIPARFLIEKAREWGEHIHVAKTTSRTLLGASSTYADTWGTLKAKLGCRCALPLFRILVGTSCNICWCGEVLEEPRHLRQGGRQGTVEMATVWEAYVDHTFGAFCEQCQK